MTRDEIKTRFPHASEAFIRANSNLDHPRPFAVMERVARHEPLEKDQGQEATTGRLHIRFVSVRKRLCDPDNLSPKWLLDCLRFSKIIPGDEPEKITLEVTQRKTRKGEQEHTIITIT